MAGIGEAIQWLAGSSDVDPRRAPVGSYYRYIDTVREGAKNWLENELGKETRRYKDIHFDWEHDEAKDGMDFIDWFIYRQDNKYKGAGKISRPKGKGDYSGIARIIQQARGVKDTTGSGSN